MSKWLGWAEIIDAHRIFSRLIFVMISVFVVWYTWYTTSWYFDNFERLGENASIMYGASGFLGVTISAIFKFATEFAQKYLDGGVDWKQKYEIHNKSIDNAKDI